MVVQIAPSVGQTQGAGGQTEAQTSRLIGYWLLLLLPSFLSSLSSLRCWWCITVTPEAAELQKEVETLRSRLKTLEESLSFDLKNDLMGDTVNLQKQLGLTLAFRQGLNSCQAVCRIGKRIRTLVLY
jgi:hypothetical protein